MPEDPTIGLKYSENAEPVQIGEDATIRAGTIIYDDVVIGDRFSTGHHALVREQTRIGDDVLVGTQTVIDGYSEIGSNVSLQTGVYVPSHTVIGDRVFIGPHAALTNDPYPVRDEDAELAGPTLEDSVTIGANATIMPNVTVGEGAFVAGGAVVTTDVSPQTLAVGVPADQRPLPPELDGGNLL